MDKVQSQFEAWYLMTYDWYIVRGRRGYRLDKDVNGEYTWDHPKHDYEVWKGAYKFFGEKE